MVTYTISGSVSGMTGEGLVLQNNASDDLAVSANGGFSFAVPVASGAGYAVSVKTQPVNPPEVCLVDNGSGTAAGDVTGVTVSCIVPPFLEPLVSTMAGSGVQGFVDDADTWAAFSRPKGLTVDRSGNVYVADTGNGRVRKITRAGVVSTVGGTSAETAFFEPGPIVSDPSGNVYVGEGNGRIYKITPAGAVSLLAGGGSDWSDGIGAGAGFSDVAGLAIDTSGNIFVAESIVGRIRKVTPAGVVTTVAGLGGPHGPRHGADNGPVSVATFRDPTGVAVDRISGNIYVADKNNNMIRKITPQGMVSTLAGSGAPGYADGIGTAATFSKPVSLAIEFNGNILVVDKGPNLIRRVTPQGHVRTMAGIRAGGSADDPAPEASFRAPEGVALDPPGNVYVADTQNHKIRKITQVPERSPTTYTVGGSVQGLAGSGLVLQINAKEELPLAADGSFRFHKAFGSTAPYVVTVKIQPSAPRQSCTVDQASGVLADADVNDVKVICAGDSGP